MNIKPVSNQEDLTAACARVEQLWGADIGSPEGDEFSQQVATLDNRENGSSTKPSPYTEFLRVGMSSGYWRGYKTGPL